MTKLQKTIKNNSKFRFTGAFKDLIAIFIVTIFVFIFSYFFNAVRFLVEFLKKPSFNNLDR